jgi:hypothetical protein
MDNRLTCRHCSSDRFNERKFNGRSWLVCRDCDRTRFPKCTHPERVEGGGRTWCGSCGEYLETGETVMDKEIVMDCQTAASQYARPMACSHSQTYWAERGGKGVELCEGCGKAVER